MANINMMYIQIVFEEKKSFSDTLAKLPHKMKALTKIGTNIVMFV